MFGKFEDYKMDLKRLIATGALLLTSLIPKSVGSYAVKSADGIDSIHPLLSSQLSAFLSNNSLLPEGVNFNLGKVKQGSIEEDSPEYDYTRSYNHFCSWTNSSDGIWNFPSSKDWAMSPALQSGEVPLNLFPWPLSNHYKELYPESNPKYPYGDNSWPRVVEQYQGGEVGTAFGHIFHLVSDATVPAHARLDPHFGELPFLEQLIEGDELYGLWPTDIYEVWTDEHKFEIINQLTPRPENVPQFSSLPELFEDLAHFTGSNFYSDNEFYDDLLCFIDKNACNFNSTGGIVEGTTIAMEGLKVYLMKEIDGKKVHVLRKGFLTDFPDTICLQDMWKVLGTKSIEYGAAALNLLVVEPPVECTNECAYGQTTCQDKTVMTCTNNDLDDCLEWAASLYCGEGQVCKDGDCVEEGTTCFDECTYSGEKGCSGGDVVQCTNNDDDNCLEWTIAEYCNNDSYCANGECVTGSPTCEDKCGTYNQTSCSGNNVMKCDYNNNTGCLELVVQESCGNECADGKCTAFSGNGSYCDTCEKDEDCVEGMNCGAFTNEWGTIFTTFCAPNYNCYSDSDCSGGYVCEADLLKIDQKYCFPKTVLACKDEKTVWYTNSCGTWIVAAENCTGTKHCVKGICVD